MPSDKYFDKIVDAAARLLCSEYLPQKMLFGGYFGRLLLNASIFILYLFNKVRHFGYCGVCVHAIERVFVCTHWPFKRSI